MKKFRHLVETAISVHLQIHDEQLLHIARLEQQLQQLRQANAQLRVDLAASQHESDDRRLLLVSAYHGLRNVVAGLARVGARGVPPALVVIFIAALTTTACGPQHVKLTIPQLRDLETCVLQDDQVERQNCVERLYPTNVRP